MLPTHNDRNVIEFGKGGFTALKVTPITPLTAAERDAKRRNELRQATEKKEQSDLDVVSKFSSVSSKRTEKKIEKVVDSDLRIF